MAEEREMNRIFKNKRYMDYHKNQKYSQVYSRVLPRQLGL